MVRCLSGETMCGMENRETMRQELRENKSKGLIVNGWPLPDFYPSLEVPLPRLGSLTSTQWKPRFHAVVMTFPRRGSLPEKGR